MGFWKCVVYLAGMGLLSFAVGRILPKGRFTGKGVLFRSCSFERDGRIYERLHIRKWQNKVPDMSRIFPRWMPGKQLCGTDPDRLAEMIRETCVAEAIHLLLCVTGLYCMRLWPGRGGVFVSLLNVVGNLVFVIIQRYNRPRFIRLQKNIMKRNR